MVHRVLKQAEEDLDRQSKMNLAFIKSLPKISRETFKELGSDPIIGEFSVLGSGFIPSGKGFKTIGDEPRIRKKKGGK